MQVSTVISKLKKVLPQGNPEKPPARKSKVPGDLVAHTPCARVGPKVKPKRPRENQQDWKAGEIPQCVENNPSKLIPEEDVFHNWSDREDKRDGFLKESPVPSPCAARSQHR